MKTLLLSAGLALTLASLAPAIDAPPPAAPPTARDAQELADRLADATEQIAKLEERLAAVEKRLGDSFGSSSPFDTVERRLEDLEKDVKDLKRGR